MKLLTAIALGAAASQTTLAAVLPHQQEPLTHDIPTSHPSSEKYLIELAPYQTRWVTEEEKWDLKLVRFPSIHLEDAIGG
jgi:leucyl aminopeptidase